MTDEEKAAEEKAKAKAEAASAAAAELAKRKAESEAKAKADATRSASVVDLADVERSIRDDVRTGKLAAGKGDAPAAKKKGGFAYAIIGLVVGVLVAVVLAVVYVVRGRKAAP